MSHLVITIAREHGSGGRILGEKLAKRLNIPCYNSQLISQTALQSGFSEKFVAENEEKKPESFLFSMAMAYSVSSSQPLAVRLFNEQSKVIRELAQKGSCILVGRAAHYVLREHPRLMRVFVTAPLEQRIHRIMQTDGLSRTEAEKLIRKKDKQRAAFTEFYTDHRWGSACHYDLCINTAAFGIDGAVDLLETLAKKQ